jgi:hypothetical protein
MNIAFEFRSSCSQDDAKILNPTGDPVVDSYRPRTELGRKLLAIRRAYVLAGGRLIDGEALDAEIALRRGGVADA